MLWYRLKVQLNVKVYQGDDSYIVTARSCFYWLDIFLKCKICYNGCKLITCPCFSSKYWRHSFFLIVSSLHMSLSAQGQTMVSALVFSTLLWLSLILALRFCLKLLLSYHRWMFEQHGRVSNFTKVWVVSEGYRIVSQLPLVVALQNNLVIS